MHPLHDVYVSSGAKFFAHQEVMTKLRNGQGQPVVTHVMATSVCAHSCAFCSVHHRPAEVLPLPDILGYLDILLRYKLKAVILSGGGNPILYKCPQTGANFNELVEAIHIRGLEIGLISDGMPLRRYETEGYTDVPFMRPTFRESWATVKPATLDKLTWVRISMAGLDHKENEVYVPDIDPTKTTLGFSYVGHDLYIEEADPYHGKVSTKADLISGDKDRAPNWPFEMRIDKLTEQIGHYVKTYKPQYVRLLPNCLEKYLISRRCEQLQRMADAIDPSVVFVQFKPPAAPKACYLGFVHPVMNTDGYILPCDSCCLNESADHKLGVPWRICHWSEIADLYEKPVRSLIKDPKTLCPGCVFTKSCDILEGVVTGQIDPVPPETTPPHVNFI